MTAPAGRGLSGDEVAAIAAGLGQGGKQPHRLGAHAAEIGCDRCPDLDALRAAHPGLDVNAVSSEQRRKRMLIADMDSTMIPVECIDEVADFAGVKTQVAAITERAMAGELDFEDALRARLALIRGLPESELAQVFAERINLNPGARVLVRTMAENGAHTALISGGFTFFTERVAAAAGFAEHRANRLLFENGALSGAVAEPILGRAAKLEVLEEIAGLGVAYHAKPALENKADAVIRHSDLTALLYLQGYCDEDFRWD